MERVLFASWILTVGGLLVALARSGCEAKGPMDQNAAVARVAAGWRVQYWLPAGHEVTRVLATVLERRGPREGVDEEIHLDEDAETATSLEHAGWKIVYTKGGPRRANEPQMRVFSPDKVLVWTGGYRRSEILSEGATILDDTVLLKLVRGEAVPDRVPVGCAGPAPSRVVGLLGN